MGCYTLLRIAVGFVALVQAQVVRNCPQGQQNLCYSVNVPSASASSGSGDLFFQIQGPASLSWIGFGQGSGMKDANIFMIYADETGKNVTLSGRSGVGNKDPVYPSTAQISLLDGSGIVDGKMTANVRCTNCANWSGGSMNFKDSQSSWIWASKSGSPVSSNSASADLDMHDQADVFTFDLTSASGGNSLNPFVQSVSTPSSTSSASSPTTSSKVNGSDSDGSKNGGDDSKGGAAAGAPTAGANSGSDKATVHRIVVAHGVLMSLAFLIFFPFGALTIRILSFRGHIWVHAGSQIFAYSFAIAGLGIGVWIALRSQVLNAVHSIFGLVIVSLLVLQPALGLIHHLIYRRKLTRTSWAVAHVWYGRALMLVGAINGGLGLQLQNKTVGGEIAYGVVAAVIFIIYVIIVVSSTTNSESGAHRETGRKLADWKGPISQHASSESSINAGKEMRAV